MKHLAVSLVHLEATLSLDPVLSNCTECRFCGWVAGCGPACIWQAVDVLNGECDSFQAVGSEG